jgi:sugar/nucleoside kinase (ribokinase family)
MRRTPPSAGPRLFDLLVVGDVNPDVVVGGVPEEILYAQVEQLVDTGTVTVGGSAAILACGAARLGLRTALVGLVGDDDAGRFMLDQLAARGVDVSGCVTHDSLATGLTVHLVREGDRAMLTFPGCLPALAADTVDRALMNEARHLHVSSFFLQPLLAAGLPDLFEEAHAASLTTSLDTNWDPADRWAGLATVLPKTDVLLPNSEEALAIAGALGDAGRPSAGSRRTKVMEEEEEEGEGEVERAVRRLAALGPLPVVKCGADGALTLTDARLLRVPTVTAGVTDAVGAGDSFDAGFLAGWLTGREIATSLALGAACGALSLRGAGGVARQPTLDEALAAAGAAARH